MIREASCNIIGSGDAVIRSVFDAGNLVFVDSIDDSTRIIQRPMNQNNVKSYPDHLEEALLHAQILLTTLKDLKSFLDVFFVKKSKELSLKVVKKNTVVFSTDF